MALPVYRRQGIMYADLPRVETASLKEGAKSFETIDRRLDQLSSFIEREGTAAAKKQAIEYAAQNPVTQEQINTAMSDAGEQKSWLSALTGGSVYDDTLKAAQGSFLSKKMEIQATTKLNQLKVLADAGKIDFDEAQLEIQDMIDGYTSAISAFNPEAALKSRAAMAADGNRVIDAIATKRASIIAEANKAAFDDGLTETQRAIEDEYFRGDLFDPTTGTTVSAESRVGIKKKTLLDNAITSMQEGRVPAVYDMVRKARINGVAKGVLSADFADNWADAYQKLSAGNMGKYKSAWDEMTDEERKEVRSLVYTEIGNLEKFRKEEDEIKKKDLREEHYDLWDEVVTAEPARREEIRTRAKEINVEYGSDLFTDTQLEQMRTGDFKKNSGNKQLIFELKRAVDRQELTAEQISTLAHEEHISFDEAGVLIDRIRTVNNDLVKAAKAGIARTVDGHKSPFLPSSMAKIDKANATNELVSRVQNGENPTEVAKDINSGIVQKSQSKNAEQVVNLLKKQLAEGSLRPMLETAVRRQMKAEAMQRAKDEFAVTGGVTDGSTLRKFGAPGLGLGPRLEAVTITNEDILDDIVINNLIEAMIENPTLIDRWVKDKAKADRIKSKIKELTGASE